MKAESLARLINLRESHAKTGSMLAQMRGRFAALAGRHEEGTAPRAVSSFNLFQTPEPIAQRMAQLIANHCNDIGSPVILEPSAGLGRLYNPVRRLIPAARCWLVEISDECCKELKAEDGDRIIRQDFEEVDPDMLPKFDAVIMNPPFKMGTDIRHIKKAFEMLKTGGLLVSLCYNGKKQNEKLKPICNSWEVLPAGSFKSEGTAAEVALLTINKQ